METAWTKEQLVEMLGPDRIDQLMFLTGCLARCIGNHPDGDGYIINDETLRKFAEAIVVDCINNVPCVYEQKLKQHFGIE